MEKGFNLLVAETKQKVVQALNESNLPIVVLEYMLSDLLIAVQHQSKTQINQESAEFNQASEKTVNGGLEEVVEENSGRQDGSSV